MKDWHKQWAEQGRWLFDTINKGMAPWNLNIGPLDNRLGHMEGILGQTMNASRLATHAELEHVEQVILWVKECRKVTAANEQERNEKWRNATAQFHDSARKSELLRRKLSWTVFNSNNF